MLNVKYFIVSPCTTSDFRFYEDASDEFREFEGTLLPLWKFAFERAKVVSFAFERAMVVSFEDFCICHLTCAMCHVTKKF